LQARQPVVAAQAGIVLEEVKRQCKGHGLGQDREIHPRHPASEGQPAEDQRQQTRQRHHQRQLQRQAMRGPPDHRQVRRAHHAENLRGNALADLLRRGGQIAVGKRGHHDFLGAGIHQPHPDHIAAKREKRHVTKGKDARIAPDQIHRERGKAKAQRLAKRLDERGRDQPRAIALRGERDGQGEKRQQAEEDQHRGRAGQESFAHAAPVGKGRGASPPCLRFPKENTGFPPGYLCEEDGGTMA
jgi:hypothetical protein